MVYTPLSCHVIWLWLILRHPARRLRLSSHTMTYNTLCARSLFQGARNPSGLVVVQHLCLSVPSTVPYNNTFEDTLAHICTLKPAIKYSHMPITTICMYAYHHHAKAFVTTFIKTPHICENMKIWPHVYTKETGWVNINKPGTTPCELLSAPPYMHRRKIILQCPTKIIQSMYAW